jgi:hypothetical protein
MRTIFAFLFLAVSLVSAQEPQPPFMRYWGSSAGGSGTSCSPSCVSDTINRVASGARVLATPVATSSYTVTTGGLSSVLTSSTLTFPGSDALGGIKTTASTRQTNVSGGSNMTPGANGMISYFGTNHATKGGYVEYFAGDTGSHVWRVDSTVEAFRISPTAITARKTTSIYAGLNVGDGVSNPPMRFNSNGIGVLIGGENGARGDTLAGSISWELGTNRSILNISAANDTVGGGNENILTLSAIRNNQERGTIELKSGTLAITAATELNVTSAASTFNGSLTVSDAAFSNPVLFSVSANAGPTAAIDIGAQTDASVTNIHGELYLPDAATDSGDSYVCFDGTTKLITVSTDPCGT